MAEWVSSRSWAGWPSTRAWPERGESPPLCACAVVSKHGHHPRLARLPMVSALGREVFLAKGLRARMLGLARLDRCEVGGL